MVSSSFTSTIADGCYLDVLAAPTDLKNIVTATNYYNVGAVKTYRYTPSAGHASGCITNYEIHITAYDGYCDTAKHGVFLTCDGSGGIVSPSLFTNTDATSVFYRGSMLVNYFYVLTSDNDYEGLYTFSLTVTNDWTALAENSPVSYSGSTFRINPDCSQETISAPSSGS